MNPMSPMSPVSGAVTRPRAAGSSGGSRTPAGRLHPLAVAVGCGVAALPLLRPAGPGNTAVADAFLLVSIGLMLLAAGRGVLRPASPYAGGVLLLMLGGALAATLADAPLGSAVVLAQDLLLLLWATAITCGAQDPAVLSAAVTTWARLAPAYALVGVLAYLVGVAPLSGVTSADGARASYTFGDPNYAGNYLVLSLFVVAAARRPRSGPLRAASMLVMLVAIAFTGSNGAAATLVVGGLTVLVVRSYRRYGVQLAALTIAGAAMLGVALVGVVLPHVDLQPVRDAAAGSVPLLRDSVGRTGSTSERATINAEGYRLYLDGQATGYGPAQTKASLAAAQAPYVKEAHNDYLATLLERGVVGCAGLLLLGAAAVRRCTVLVTHPGATGLADILPRPWLLVAGLPVMALAGGFYEVLHFRHLWTWLGIVAAVSLRSEAEARHRRGRP